VADCYPQRTGAEFLAFLRKAVKPHRDKAIHFVLDHLSTHDTHQFREWLEADKRSAAAPSFSVNHHIARIRDYVEHWNAHAEPFTWTAAAEAILAKVRLVQTHIKNSCRTTRSSTTGSRDH
jgi:hypothetical protein